MAAPHPRSPHTPRRGSRTRSTACTARARGSLCVLVRSGVLRDRKTPCNFRLLFTRGPGPRGGRAGAGGRPAPGVGVRSDRAGTRVELEGRPAVDATRARRHRLRGTPGSGSRIEHAEEAFFYTRQIRTSADASRRLGSQLSLQPNARLPIASRGPAEMRVQHTPRAMPDPPAEAPHTDARLPAHVDPAGGRSHRGGHACGFAALGKASTTQGATPRRHPPPPCRYPSPRRASRRRPPLLQPRRAARPPQARQHSSPCRASPGCAARAAASFPRSRGWTTTRRRRRRHG